MLNISKRHGSRKSDGTNLETKKGTDQTSLDMDNSPT